VEVAKKKSYGHWESETVLCRRQREVLSVQYERKAQLVRIHKVTDKSAKSTDSHPGHYHFIAPVPVQDADV